MMHQRHMNKGRLLMVNRMARLPLSLAMSYKLSTSKVTCVNLLLPRVTTVTQERVQMHYAVTLASIT